MKNLIFPQAVCNGRESIVLIKALAWMAILFGGDPGLLAALVGLIGRIA